MRAARTRALSVMAGGRTASTSIGGSLTHQRRGPNRFGRPHCQAGNAQAAGSGTYRSGGCAISAARLSGWQKSFRTGSLIHKGEREWDDLSESSQDTLDYEMNVANMQLDLEHLQPLLRNKNKKRGGKRRREDAEQGPQHDAWRNWSKGKKGKGKGQPRGKHCWSVFGAGIIAALQPRTTASVRFASALPRAAAALSLCAQPRGLQQAYAAASAGVLEEVGQGARRAMVCAAMLCFFTRPEPPCPHQVWKWCGP